MTTSSSTPSQHHTQGHLGHFTKDEQLAFDAFKLRCAQEGLLGDASASGEDDLKEGICDDGTLSRFLRARKFNVEDAYQQYSTTRAWRDANQLISLYENINIEDYEETRKLYTHWTGRRDKFGVPVFLFNIGQLTPEVMSAYIKSCAASSPSGTQAKKATKTESEAMLRLFCTYDSLTRFVLPLCSTVPDRPNSESPITQTNCIVDISGVGLLQFWRLSEHLQAASRLASSHYPETLGRTYVIGAPSFFPTIWGWINKWFDPITVSKISIVPAADVLSTLSSTIDPANIPRKYGGQLDYEFGMMPKLDPEIRDMLTWQPSGSGISDQTLPIGPMRFVNGEDGKRTAVAVGSANGKQRKEQIATLKE